MICFLGVSRLNYWVIKFSSVVFILGIDAYYAIEWDLWKSAKGGFFYLS